MPASTSFFKRSQYCIVALSIGVIALIGGSIAAKAADSSGRNLAAPPQNEIKIVATEFKFAAPSRHIVAGQPVTLVLDNSEAESEHAIFFPALGVRLFAQAGETVRKTVLFDKAGEFAFVCDLPGHREAGMIGKLAVRQGDMIASPEVAGLIAK
jgi:plastocyanin